MADITEQYVNSVRQYLRVSHEYFDGEISDLIGAARADLIMGGISPEKVNDESDPLIKRAVVVYVKAEFGLDNADAEKYKESYNMLKRHLMLSNEYISEGATG